LLGPLLCQHLWHAQCLAKVIAPMLAAESTFTDPKQYATMNSFLSEHAKETGVIRQARQRQQPVVN
jgi:hypothetical protein